MIMGLSLLVSVGNAQELTAAQGKILQDVSVKENAVKKNNVTLGHCEQMTSSYVDLKYMNQVAQNGPYTIYNHRFGEDTFTALESIRVQQAFQKAVSAAAVNGEYEEARTTALKGADSRVYPLGTRQEATYPCEEVNQEEKHQQLEAEVQAIKNTPEYKEASALANGNDSAGGNGSSGNSGSSNSSAVATSGSSATSNTSQAPTSTTRTGACADGDRYCIELQEPIAGVNKIEGNTGIELFSNYIKQIYIYGASIIGIICVLVIVVSGIQISMGGANSEFVNQGKERIMQALLSLILLFASALILRTINPGFFGVAEAGMIWYQSLA